MAHPITTPIRASLEHATDEAWALVVAAAQHAEAASAANQLAWFAVNTANLTNPSNLTNPAPSLSPISAGDPDAVLVWRPAYGWEPAFAAGDPRHALMDLYLPICSATRSRPLIIGHLGQSLDGFIATHAGDSQYVTGAENILHLHRMRALCDAIVVGAGTVAADDPQLTTRHVSGPSPLRVVLDPMRRLGEHYKVFRDSAAETLYICGRSAAGSGDSHMGRAVLIAVADDTPTGLDVAEVVRLLRARGCSRIFVEGGGVTVSMFLEANLLDRLHVAIAPLLIGNGRPAIRLPARAAISDCRRPAYRVFRMGGDVFFDCSLKMRAGDDPPGPAPPVSRVI